MKEHAIGVRAAVAAMTVALAACGGADSTRDTNLQVQAQPAATTATSEEWPSGAHWVLEVSAGGNAARYRVREQLVGFDFPNDAVGTTDQLSGRIALDAQGNLLPDGSRIVVGTADFESDQERRDGFIRNRLLRAEEFPSVVLQPTAVRGLPHPLPTSGTLPFEIVGDLTVLDVTRPTTWQVTGEFAPDRVTGTAATRFDFEKFNLEKPRVRSVLSVADTIGLEYDFTLDIQVQRHP
jgi:polyisoprenoid-binding protein YceI